jgi:hypothetical protein
MTSLLRYVTIPVEVENRFEALYCDYIFMVFICNMHVSLKAASHFTIFV